MRAGKKSWKLVNSADAARFYSKEQEFIAEKKKQAALARGFLCGWPHRQADLDCQEAAWGHLYFSARAGRDSFDCSGLVYYCNCVRSNVYTRRLNGLGFPRLRAGRRFRISTT
jgi:hypothetical protein